MLHQHRKYSKKSDINHIISKKERNMCKFVSCITIQ